MSSFFLKVKMNDRGMTLIEVLVVLVLLLFILTPAINAITATNRIWSHSEAINPRIAEANTSMLLISKEIRRAASPARTVDPVLVEDAGQRLVIYHYNEAETTWEKIIYQVTADNYLKKVILSDPDPAAVLSLVIPDEDDSVWHTLAEGVTSKPFNRPEDSSMVEVNIQISDTSQINKRFTPFDLASNYMIRSREIGAIIGAPVLDETEPEVIPVHKIIVSPTFARMVITKTNTHELSLNITQIWPANATDKSVRWQSSHPDWVKVEPSNDTSLATIKLMKKESDWNYWEFIGLIPPNVTITATANTGEAKATCKININKWL
ncbi:Prokaryotic N-terminal methylation site [Syntrophomonas zehnderi OL-4]|uniref:Prokaryotic N-terminal methylation site n=1 Tax=Syntrophomonas zehnderi OL-4 TaxID=690567 RepID=A0A0E4GB26_9FIRM|nr:prepilin-type N-terminal cleavage/methylation domain-containing protein [Syntrophomonas zehnderi]CFX31399.1 Prokaryotic N-terminal methylation site [Syntrophomonas zehnderi OL-4]